MDALRMDWKQKQLRTLLNNDFPPAINFDDEEECHVNESGQFLWHGN